MIILPTYEFTAESTQMEYRFTSAGARGEFLKAVRFINMGGNFYTMGFGDCDPVTGSIDDGVISNNGDIDRIMGTLASIVQFFVSINAGGNCTYFLQYAVPNAALSTTDRKIYKHYKANI